MRLLVSIHDVTPAHAREVEALWNLCASRGIVPALLVVPNWHGQWRLERSPDFVRWLRTRQAEGAGIFLHGERHDEVGTPRTLAHEIRAFGKTGREGEFLALNRSQAEERIARGVRLLRELGLDPIGFVPPAWLYSRETRRIVSDLRLRLSEDTSSVVVHPRAERIPSPVIRWSARTAFRALLSAVVAGVVRNTARAPLLRVALHPGDVGSRVVLGSISRTLDMVCGPWRPTRYAAL